MHILRIFKSVVKHKNLNPFSAKGDYVEGENNKAIGYIAEPLWYVRFTNSHGNSESFAGGSIKKYGPFYFARGRAYGYLDDKATDEGVPILAIAFLRKKSEQITVFIPKRTQYVKITAQYLEKRRDALRR